MSESKRIGPSFYDELVAAGLAGLPFSWNSDGAFIFSDEMTAAQISGVQAVYAAHDPTKESIADLQAKRAALLAAANTETSGMSDAYVAGLLDDADTAKFKTWAAYKLGLSKLDLTLASVVWPTPPASI
jgi:hypothetical protein